jgi:hypothetical protein
MIRGLLWDYLPEDQKRQMLLAEILRQQQAAIWPQPIKYPNPQQPISTTGIRG